MSTRESDRRIGFILLEVNPPYAAGSRYCRLCGICCSEEDDSSLMTYHFTPAFFAALKMGA
jgi:hypothetical protein